MELLSGVASAGRSGLHRVDFVDGMRGVAALYVVMHHVWQFAINDPLADRPGWFGVATVFKFGSFAVAVFIVVSGYCLMLPVLRYGGIGSQGHIRQFAWRRSRRILPPYLLALALSILLIRLHGDLRHPTGTPWDITLPSFTTGNVVSHLVMVHNWSESWRYAFNPPLWSIALEFQIYFVFALVLLPIWRRWGLTTTIAAAFGLAVVPGVLGFGFAAPWMVGLFGFGMAAAAIGTDPARFEQRWRVPWRPVALVLAASVPIVTATVSNVDSNETRDMMSHIVVGLATLAALVLMSIDVTEGRRPSVVHRLLSSPSARATGLISYSLYLVHYPIVAVVSISWLAGHDYSVPARFALLTAICVPASLAVSAAFYLVVERRFLHAAPRHKPAGTSVTIASRHVEPSIQDG